MNSYEFSSIVHEVHDKMVTLTHTKGLEYRAGDDDQFANFKKQSVELNMPMEKVLMVYLSKHLDSIRNYVRNCPVSHVEHYDPKLSEPIEGRVDDAILYLILLRGMVRERKQERNDVQPVQVAPAEQGLTREELIKHTRDKVAEEEQVRRPYGQALKGAGQGGTLLVGGYINSTGFTRE